MQNAKEKGRRKIYSLPLGIQNCSAPLENTSTVDFGVEYISFDTGVSISKYYVKSIETLYSQICLQLYKHYKSNLRFLSIDDCIIYDVLIQ